MEVEARDRQEGGLDAMSQLGIDPSVDKERELVVSVEVDGVMQLDICSGALEDGFRRSQTGGRQLF